MSSYPQEETSSDSHEAQPTAEANGAIGASSDSHKTKQATKKKGTGSQSHLNRHKAKEAAMKGKVWTEALYSKAFGD